MWYQLANQNTIFEAISNGGDLTSINPKLVLKYEINIQLTQCCGRRKWIFTTQHQNMI